jgi:hypothetical protein
MFLFILPNSPRPCPIFNGVPGTITCCRTCSKKRNNEATVIQAYYRGHQGRKLYSAYVRRKAATIIQAYYRGHLLRELYRRACVKREAAQKEEARARREEDRKAMVKAATELSEGAEAIQGYIQEHYCRREVCLTSAAILIQKYFRDYLYSNESRFREYLLQTANSFSDDETFRFIQFLTEKYNNSHELSNLFWKELSGFDLGNCDSPPYAEVLKLVIPKFRT